jgi:mutator protein MutT
MTKVAIGILVDHGRVLICKRKAGEPFGGYWEFPGGKCEPDESPAHCVAREIREELELQVRPTHALAPIEHDYSDRTVTIYPFLCQIESGTPRAVSAAEFRWVPVQSLREFAFPAANAELVDSLVATGAIDLRPAGA